MMLDPRALRIDPSFVERRILDFISEQVSAAGLKGGIVAVSGGLDSSVTLALSAKALGGNRVRALMMPEQGLTSESDITDALEVAEMFGVTCDVVDITPVIRAIYSALPNYDPQDLISAGNVKARVRMIINYYYANRLGKMVIGSSNKSELLTGYFTKYGDGAADLFPLADLYKTQVRQLARHLGLPRRIIEKVPTAGLWPGQSDEGELGVKYELLDLILLGWERGMSVESVAEELGVGVELVRGVFERVRRSRHKRVFPLILRLSSNKSELGSGSSWGGEGGRS
ncbi:NAD+ synthase [Candidatus Bathyarchaeota archaeon]|nr:MAG: NAD+ synthase [Candidatus Bathyarchaeota archaeon]